MFRTVPVMNSEQPKPGGVAVIGTSHIAQESLDEVKAYIEREKPDIVAVELDRGRYIALMSEQKSRPGIGAVAKIGVKGYLFAMLGAWAEKKLGQVVGVKPGSEMKQAIRSAHHLKLKVALIDQPIEITLKRLSKAITWKEKWQFLKDIVNGLVFRKQEVDFDLRTVPAEEVVEKMISKVKGRYPNVYHVLVEERNHVMIRNLRTLQARHPDKRIVAVVGAGHEQALKHAFSSSSDSVSVSYSLPGGASVSY